MGRLLPGCCILCGSVSFSGYPGLCSVCRGDCVPINGPVCGRCGRPLISEDSLCSRCRDRPDNCENRSAADYRGRLREVISLYKLSGKKELAGFLSELLLPAFGETLVGKVVVPVPPSPQRLKGLGWDPVVEVLRCVEKRLSILILPLLVRNEGVQQKELGYEERRENARTLFSVRWGRRAPKAPAFRDPRSSGVVLFDDVFTTGATMSVCRRLLETEGLKVTGSLTIAVD